MLFNHALSCRAYPLLSRWVALWCVVLSSLLWAGHAFADDEDDHHRAQRAVEQGKAMPLRALLAQLERKYAGKAVKVELEEDDGRYLYEVRLVRRTGQVLELEVDARSGRVLKVEDDD